MTGDKTWKELTDEEQSNVKVMLNAVWNYIADESLALAGRQGLRGDVAQELVGDRVEGGYCLDNRNKREKDGLAAYRLLKFEEQDKALAAAFPTKERWGR